MAGRPRKRWKGLRARLTDRFKLIAVDDTAADAEILKRGSLADVLQHFGGRCPTGGPAGSWFLHDGFRVVARIVPETDRRLNLREYEDVGELRSGDRLVNARISTEIRTATVSAEIGTSNDSKRKRRKHEQRN